jgi:hypothetical protein
MWKGEASNLPPSYAFRRTSENSVSANVAERLPTFYVVGCIKKRSGRPGARGLERNAASVLAWRYTHRFTVTRVRVSTFASSVLNFKQITHDRNLVDAEAEAESFLDSMAELGDRLGPLLLQLPPSFDVEGMGVLEDFLERMPGSFRYANNHYQNQSPSTLARFLEIRRGEI